MLQNKINFFNPDTHISQQSGRNENISALNKHNIKRHWETAE
jgi:hypothetical protein